MLTQNRISATLSPEDLQEIMVAIETLRSKLPFLLSLSPEERRALPRVGDKSRAFISKAVEVATQNEDILPRAFDLAEFRRDAKLYEELYPVLIALSKLQQQLDDSVIVISSEAYSSALLVYNTLKTVGRGAGLDGVLDDLAQRFARRSRRTTQPTGSALD